ncbi:acyltransferase [Blastopirellula sp. J2-11]|uniref:acyltransferase n=1 Tax=Blastopirellula sp. J2-11 TaxID=2943192 RepID=UPI002905810C|nr:acyltransferase [Blastopirellula sp. J2-11]
MSDSPSPVRLGLRAEIDQNVMLGYVYPGWSGPTVLGDDAVVRMGSVIYADTQIGDRFTCGHNVVIRACCTIGDNVVVLHQSTLEGNLSIGDGVKLMAHVYVSSTTKIESLVFVGPGTTFLNDKYPMRQRAPVQGAIVKEGAAIGGGVTVCPGVTIGEGAFVGAGTLVNRDVPPRMLAYGVPMRLRELPADLPEVNDSELLLNSSDLWGRSRGTSADFD